MKCPRVRLAALISGLLLFFGTAVASQDQASAGFGGVGLQVVPIVTGELVVLRVVAGTPAEQFGLLPGDLIDRIDDFPLHGSDFGVVVAERLWGEVGSTVVLHYRRPGQPGTQTVRLQRTPMATGLTVTPSLQPGQNR
ncbi:MAG: PDZ domain-containing protein [Desulfuromonadales bacterium]|nr:PDZ domain-containing protein [Desulfuromonadales bacterium]